MASIETSRISEASSAKIPTTSVRRVSGERVERQHVGAKPGWPG
jgi:hypothetical protein